MRGESRQNSRTFLVAQWLRFCLPVQGLGVQTLVRAKIPHALHPKKKKNRKQKQDCNKFKNDPHQKHSLNKKYRIGSSFELGVMTQRRAGLGHPESFQGGRGVSGCRSKQCLIQHWGEVGTSATAPPGLRSQGGPLNQIRCYHMCRISRAVLCFALLCLGFKIRESRLKTLPYKPLHDGLFFHLA